MQGDGKHDAYLAGGTSGVAASEEREATDRERQLTAVNDKADECHSDVGISDAPYILPNNANPQPRV
jgi:hypothetical protein